MTTVFALTKQTWPKYSERDAFYGDPRGSDGVNSEWQRANIVTVTIPWRCNVQHVEVHRKVAESFLRVLNWYWDYVGHDQSKIDADHLNLCGGGFNYRLVRGGNTLSNHAYGAAVDWAPDENPLGKPWHDGGGMLPVEFLEAFQAEGWSLGALYKGRKDAMHVEATDLGQGPIAPVVTGERPALKLGDAGPFVIELQKRLGVAQSGTIDDATYRAVLAFQQARGLQMDGIVGAGTWAALPPLPPPITKPPPPVVLRPVPPPVVQPSQPPTPFDPVLQEIWKIILDKSGLHAEIDAKKAEWTNRHAAIAKEFEVLAREIHDWEPSALLRGPVVVTPAPPAPPIIVPPIPGVPLPKPLPAPTTELSPEEIDAIASLAASSPVASHAWSGRGRAPIGYVKGMAVFFGLMCRKYEAGDSAAKAMAKANTGDDGIDALSWYDSNFRALGMRNDTSGLDTLRHLFVLLLGLGMRESSGNCFEGRDTTVSNPTADSAEAGLFQQSHDSFVASPLLSSLMNLYLANPAWGFQSIFREGLQAVGTQNVGVGPGAEFQRLCKVSPSFAVECAAVGLRTIRKHWGPINRKEAELLPAADDLLKQVQQIVAQKGPAMSTYQNPSIPVAPSPTPSSPVTTTLGSGAIGAAVIGLIQMFMSGHVDIQPLITDIGIIFAGMGGIFAKDWNAHGGTKTQ